tara:strand:- start:382 stop:579 length:198 start_codon:yes stop_codon:yes gene_type:complete
MKYQVYNQETNKVVYEAEFLFEAEDAITFEFDWKTHTIIKFHECRGCEQEGYERRDYFRIKNNKQ